MSTESNVTFVGNLTKDWTVRFTETGKAIASNSIAVEKSRKVGDTWEKTTSFFNVTAWEGLGENFASLPKGTRVIVTGTLEVRDYEKDGEKRQSLDITVEAGGPELRWATAEVTRVTKDANAKPAAKKAAPRQAPLDEEEPF